MVENEIPLKESHKNKESGLVLVCESKTSRDELRELVRVANVDLEVNSPNSKQIPITLVGLAKSYEPDEIMKMLATQMNLSKYSKFRMRSLNISKFML